VVIVLKTPELKNDFWEFYTFRLFLKGGIELWGFG